MYYSNGNYEAFARPRKPQGVDQKSAHLVGAGIASLAAAFLIRDGRMDGSRITIYEASDIAGGALDGIKDPKKGFLVRGGREFENHYECTWELFRSIPSLKVAAASVLDEFYWLNQDLPNSSLRRTTQNRGEANATDGKLTLSRRAQHELSKLSNTPDEDLYDKRITDVLGDEFFGSNFWVYWKSMFAFEPWHSALEMKRYLNRCVHHLGGLADLSAITYTSYNQYESLVLPLVAWLEQQGVQIQYDTRVTNVLFGFAPGRKIARRIEWLRGGQPGGRDLAETDLVFVTNGSCVENSAWGDHDAPAPFDPEIREGGCWALWRNIAAQDPEFGRPDVFCTHTDQSTWESATLTTLDDAIPPYIEAICQRDPFAFGGHIVTGGVVTVRDSAWQLSWLLDRQPHFAEQPRNQLVAWLYGLYTDVPGDYVRKPMRDCTGEEIAREWLYHLGVPLDRIDDLAARSVHCVPCMMPFITAFFLPRGAGDRPAVVPAQSVNFAFLGQFVETPRDIVFTVEYSVRTAMEAVYTLLGVERGVPETWGSRYDLRALLSAATVMRDGAPLPLPTPVEELLERSDAGELLQHSGWFGNPDPDPDLATVGAGAAAPRALGIL